VPIVIVPIPPEVVARIGEPAYLIGTIPAGTYNGQGAAVPSVAVQNFLVTHEGVPTEAVYAMTKSMFDNLDQLTTAHAAAKAIRKESAATGMPLPLHPGAEKYYREAGILK
jgi:TRAP transporter TAXI family solute receptor